MRLAFLILLLVASPCLAQTGQVDMGVGNTVTVRCEVGGACQFGICGDGTGQVKIACPSIECPPVPKCPEDLNGDGVLNAADQAILVKLQNAILSGFGNTCEEVHP